MIRANSALGGPPMRSAAVAVSLLCASAPVLYIALRVAAACRNLPFWDEFDSVLGFLLRLDEAAGWREKVAQFFALENEHRTVTSRIIVAALYWITGTVNFDFICIAGNLFLVGMCAALVWSVQGFSRRVRLVVVLSLGLFQLELYETFLWSGASIDHFQVLFLAAAALVLLGHGARWSSLLGVGFAVLATFTLAHGCGVWVAGAVLLWFTGRRRMLVVWAGCALVALAVFFQGFAIYSSHRLTAWSPVVLGQLGRFWLALLGAPLTFGARDYAPGFGLLLLAGLGGLLLRGIGRREPVIASLALFAIGSLALVAFGRLPIAGPRIESRYLVLGALAWSLTFFLALEQWTNPGRPFRLLLLGLPALSAFNLCADLRAAPFAETFLISRDYAAVRFKQFGEDGHAGGFQLHPDRERAKAVLTQTALRGLYEMPRFSDRCVVPAPRANPAMVTYVTDLTATGPTVGFEGWAMLPTRRSQPGEIRVVLRSDHSLLTLTTFSMPRPDVARAFLRPDWHDCGYNFVILRHRLPPEKFQIGLLIVHDGRADVKMTEQWLDLRSAHSAPTQLASGQ